MGCESASRARRLLWGSGFVLLTGCGNVIVTDTDGSPGSMSDGAPIDPTIDAAPSDAQPRVVSTSPASSAAGVAVDAAIRATFSEPMDPESVTNAFVVADSSRQIIEGDVSYDGLVATFTPSDPLAPGTSYSARITVDARDLDGNPLVQRYDWGFTTVTTRCVSAAGALGCETSIAAAIAASQPGDSIAVAGGTYAENLDIQKTVTLLAGFSPDFAERDPYSYTTTLNPFDASRTVVTIRPEPDNDSPPPAAPTIDGFVVSGADADSDGGGFCLLSSDALLRSNVIIGNRAAIRGGGVFIQGGAPFLVGNVIENNAVASEDGSGSGVYIAGSSATLTQNDIRGNTTGGIDIVGSEPAPTVQLIENNIVENDVKGMDFTPKAAGVAIAYQSIVTIRGGRISGNRIENGRAGGLHAVQAFVTVEGVRFEGNAVNVGGSGVAVEEAALSLLSSVVADNEGGEAGVWADGSSPVTIVNSTIVGNPAIGVRTAYDMLLANSIIEGEPVGILAADPARTIVATGNNFFGNETDASGFALDSKANLFIDPIFGDFLHLDSRSSMIGAGVVKGLKFPGGADVALPEYDVDGETRRREGDDAIDIGADEWSE